MKFNFKFQLTFLGSCNNQQITDRFFITFPRKRGIMGEAFLKSVSKSGQLTYKMK